LSEIIDEVLKDINESKIFRNREILRPDYIPEELPHRHEQIRSLTRILSPLIKGSRPSNVFIYGLTGTGKTAVTKFVLNSLVKKSNGIQFFYINVRHEDTPYRVLASLLEYLGIRVPRTGLPTSDLYRQFTSILKAKNKMTLVVFDEIDSMLKNHGDDLLYKMTRINEYLGSSLVSIIGITNDVKFVEMLDARVKSSLGEEELIFPPYNAEQLKDILKSRSERAFLEGVVNDEVISLCAAFAAREHGDARRALDLLRVAAEIAERLGETKVKEQHVYEARRELEKDRVAEVVATLPFHGKMVMIAIILLSKKQKSLTTGEVYDVYKSLCKRMKLESVTLRRVSDIISELDMVGVISAKVVSKGRYGKTKEIVLASSIESIIYGLKKEDSEINELIQEILGDR
jgi:cell division control protein 6